jgi:hypothetical protein
MDSGVCSSAVKLLGGDFAAGAGSAAAAGAVTAIPLSATTEAVAHPHKNFRTRMLAIRHLAPALAAA